MSAVRGPSCVVPRELVLPCPAKAVRLEEPAGAQGLAPLLRLENVKVEDLGGCGRAAADRLSRALARGVPFIMDRKRKRFYEAQAGDERFYIHVLKGGRKVLLLLRWVTRVG